VEQVNAAAFVASVRPLQAAPWASSNSYLNLTQYEDELRAVL
jgi:hypothetical protein